MLARIFTTAATTALVASLAMACSPSAPAASADATAPAPVLANAAPPAAEPAIAEAAHEQHVTPTETVVATKNTLPLAKMANFSLKDTTGKTWELYKMTDAKAVVITMHTKGCPIGQQLTPDFHDLQKAYEAKGVKFLMINPNTHDTPAMIAAEAKDFGVTIPILKDTDQSVTEPLGVERATETLIVEPKTWKILYQGPINDRVTFGRAKAKADNDFAAVTLDAMLAGKAVTPSYHMTDGCIISFDKRSKG